MVILFLALCLFCGVVNFLCSIMILRTLRSAGIDVGFYEMRWQVHKHLKTYRKISGDRGVGAGFPYYGYWTSLGGLVLFGGLLLISISR